DFWDDRFLDFPAGSMSLDLPPGSCKVLALRRKLPHPQVLGTSRHISQGIVDLTYVRWQNEQRVLEGRSRVVGQDDYELRIDSGKGNTFAAAEVSSNDAAAGVTAAGKQDGNQLRVTIKSPASREVAWKIRFAADAK